MNEKADQKKPGIESESDKPRPVQQKIEDAVETGGPKGPEPTRFGDWERKGRCVDF